MLFKSEVIYLRWLLLSACCWMGFRSSSSDELLSRDCEPHSEADGNYAGGRSTHPSYPDQICLLIIAFCPPAFLTEVQLKAGFLQCPPCTVPQGGWVLLQRMLCCSSVGAQCLPCHAPEPNDCHLYNSYCWWTFFFKLYICLLKIANFLCLCIKRTLKCRFSALHIKLF